MLRGGSPASQYSIPFLQGMVDRLLLGFHKYGHVKESVDRGMDPVQEAHNRIREYSRTGNTEWLIDAANYCMIEFMHPSHKDAHYRPTDSDESPGRAMRDGTRHSRHADQMEGDL